MSLRKGDVVKTYDDWTNPYDFKNWAELVSHDPLDEIIMTIKEGAKIVGKLPFVYSEFKRSVDRKFAEGGYCWYLKEKWLIETVDGRKGEIILFKEGRENVILPYPFKIEKHYPPDKYEVSVNDEYLGFVDVIEDCYDLIKIKHKSTKEIPRLGAKLILPKNDGKTIIWSAQRWKCRMYRNVHYSELKKRYVRYKDWGHITHVKVKGNEISFRFQGSRFKKKLDLNDFYILDDFITHRIVPFYLTTDSNYSSYSNEWDDDVENR